MLWFLLRRAGWLLLVLFIASFVVFGLLYLAPGSPITYLLGPRSATPDQIARVTEQYGLNDPFLVRFWDWLIGVLQGDLGRSLVYSDEVGTLILSRLPNTILLVGVASLLSLIHIYTYNVIDIAAKLWSRNLDREETRDEAEVRSCGDRHDLAIGSQRVRVAAISKFFEFL